MKKELKEEHWKGLGVSDGVVVGRVLRVHSGTQQVYRAKLDEMDMRREVRRLRAAVRLSRRQLLAIRTRAEKELGVAHSYIFDAHLLMLEDNKLIGEIEEFILKERANAEWAVKVVGDKLLAVYAAIKDDYLRERGSDIEDVTQRILVALSGGHPSYKNLIEDAVLVAEDLLPSTVAELDYTKVRGMAMDNGGWTSHTAIIARGLGIPAVVGLRDLSRRARTGDPIIVDADKGAVVLHPSARTTDFYRSQKISQESRTSVAAEKFHGPVRTLDGVDVRLRANIELPAEFVGVAKFGAEGVGLYRSEFLLSQRGPMPSEEEQCEAYKEVARIGGDAGATVRLFDLGGEKISGAFGDAERNPALGLRAIRFSLRWEKVLRLQARSILRAAAFGKLSIVLPMISDLTDVRRARSIIEEERVKLESEGKRAGTVKVGAMIEVPSAVFVADKIAREVDFFSLGTNDLVQYLLAVDRGNDDVAEWFRSLHPAVLQSIKRTLDAARDAEIPAVVCGEMAATPAYAVILLGLGATDFSMTASSLPRVRQTVSQIKYEDAREIAEKSLECATADDVEELVRERLGAKWPQLFPAQSLPAKKSKV
ncbi:MAG: phosphoenolpyruvate--protein phosphotransferase [Acidobacteria bacterium 13_1_20CM_3_53_8]|nr:MAG: phosphoenolpyruvate--protein phosphotransferase [Acidobacteria bacterium 13_1_20CM_3_53_8]